MNRSEVITQTATRLSRDPEMVEEIATTFFEIVAEALSQGDSVNIRRFGKFEPRLRRAMSKPNPRSGDIMHIAERLSAAFLPSEILKARLNGEATEDV